MTKFLFVACSSVESQGLTTPWKSSFQIRFDSMYQLFHGWRSYTVLQKYRHTRNFFGNQGNHQNFEKSLLSYKLSLISIGMKQKKIEEKNSKWPTKKTSFSNSANSQYFFMKFSWIGPWVSRIDWWQRHWCSSTYMAARLSDISSKMA